MEDKLTKEQIEAEGWVQSGHQGTSQMYEKNNFILKYSETTKEALFMVKGSFLVRDYNSPTFSGKCPDLKTFKFVCKLLNV